jgi:nitrogen fixation NifU-like protein
MDLQLYQEELLDHYKHPRNYGKLENADLVTEILNPSCGDEIALELALSDNHLSAIAFRGKGCVISQASASLLTQHVVGKSIEELVSLTKDDMLALVGIPLGPTRLRCALLVLECLHKALHK